MRTIFPAVLATAIGCAIIAPFPAAAAKSKERVLYSFAGGTDGTNPESSLIELGGELYGTTFKGGTNNAGIVFSINAKSGAETVVHTFGSSSDGREPNAGLINVKGTFFGTTGGGGTNCQSDGGCGTVYSLDLGTGREAVLYSFCTLQNCIDGEGPLASLFSMKGSLYGTTVYGGNVGQEGVSYGTVFGVDGKTGSETLLYPFCNEQNCADGEWPLTSLIAVKGVLYGTTSTNAFAIDPNTGAETVLYTFCSQENCTDGDSPQAGLIDLNGTLYGTTIDGGAHCTTNIGCGTVFALDPNTDSEKVIYSFCARKNCADGATPIGNLIVLNGKLYGVTLGGGNNCGDPRTTCGVVFSVDPATGVEKVVYSFCSQQNCADGWTPNAGLLDVKGTLYGTTYEGGANCQSNGGCGTVFAIKLP